MNKTHFRGGNIYKTVSVALVLKDFKRAPAVSSTMTHFFELKHSDAMSCHRTDKSFDVCRNQFDPSLQNGCFELFLRGDLPSSFVNLASEHTPHVFD